MLNDIFGSIWVVVGCVEGGGHNAAQVGITGRPFTTHSWHEHIAGSKGSICVDAIVVWCVDNDEVFLQLNVPLNLTL